jgi:multidrug efflux pump subunit AcrA (membrane-fusion protein)
MRSLNTKYCWLLCLLVSGICSCHSGSKKEDAADTKQAAGTPVTVTTISNEPLTEYVDLNATATFQQKNYVKANVNGYVTAVNAILGKYVNTGQILFTLKTKEAMTIGNAVNKLDPGFKFSGINNIKATASGYITLLSHQVGDYVQDGEQLAVISDENSFAFILNLPFELKQYLLNNHTVALTLPDGAKLNGVVTSSMPTVDPGSQTQSIVIKVPNSRTIPENLIAKVRIIKINKPNATSLPKATVLTNDVQSEFWVMMMTDSNTAVKVPVKKGIETKDKVEITDPKFNARDKILLTGNYGLPDTAKVTIVHKQE